MPAPVIAPLRTEFRSLAEAVVPEAEGLAEAQWLAVEGIVETALAERPARIRRQIALLIRVITALSVLMTGRRFVALDRDRRTGLLAALERSPLLLLRRGVWGLRTLVFMGYYARPEGAAAVGYRADPRGWEARR